MSRDVGYINSSDLNQQCVHNSSLSPPYLTQCFYEAFVRIHVFQYLGLRQMQFLPPNNTWAHIAPTWNDSVYRHQVMQVCTHVPTPIIYINIDIIIMYDVHVHVQLMYPKQMLTYPAIDPEFCLLFRLFQSLCCLFQ